MLHDVISRPARETPSVHARKRKLRSLHPLCLSHVDGDLYVNKNTKCIRANDAVSNRVHANRAGLNYVTYDGENKISVASNQNTRLLKHGSENAKLHAYRCKPPAF